jgi:hypothetical protein
MAAASGGDVSASAPSESAAPSGGGDDSKPAPASEESFDDVSVEDIKDEEEII